jgi:hypothetical protein
VRQGRSLRWKNRELGKLPRPAWYGPILQLGAHGHEPWLSVDDRCGPTCRACRGHGRGGRRCSKLSAMVASSAAGRGQSSVTMCLVGKGRRPAAAPWVRGSNPAPSCSAVRDRSGECRVTWDSYLPAVTVRARRRPRVSSGARTQRGPGSRSNRVVVRRTPHRPEVCAGSADRVAGRCGWPATPAGC